uniref:Tetratricopeptide TPR_2 repeat protein n=1 Tax=Nannocystis exedens TaxID=54 RepID=A0A3Q8I2N7_9BACT|nr:tetratricopeptide TPR_2 repeat protein [Nannocystis exedens]
MITPIALEKLQGERDAALARFSATPEGPWPAATATLVSTRTPAQERLEEGRRLTRAGDHAGAIAAFDAALELDGDLAAAFSGRGYARLLARDFAAARKDFEAALTMDAKPAFQAAVLFNLGQVAAKLADRTAARDAYTRSLELRPNKTVQAALTALGPP